MTSRTFRNRSAYAIIVVRSIYGSDFRRRNYFRKTVFRHARRMHLLARWAARREERLGQDSGMESVEDSWEYLGEDLRVSPEDVYQHRHDGLDWHPVAKSHPASKGFAPWIEKDFNSLEREDFERFISLNDEIKNVIWVKDSMYCPCDTLHIGDGAEILYFKKTYYPWSTDSVMDYEMVVSHPRYGRHTIKVEYYSATKKVAVKKMDLLGYFHIPETEEVI